MRPLYFFLRITLPYALTVFYRRTKTLNAQKKFNAQTIFVSNHPSAFIDPLVVANYQRPILYFVTRGDIFSWWLSPITWASHMVPIFREAEDGADSHEKNKDTFSYLEKVLLRKKSLVLFGEGYTDNVFIRSLKPIKKGPARIAFDTMAASKWEIDIKVQPVGINYSHPKYFRSDMLLALGDCINLKDYKELYDESRAKAITALTREIQKQMRGLITCIDDKDLAPFLEHLLILSRKGMNHEYFDKEYSLEDRYQYSRKLASKINESYSEDDEKWAKLKEFAANYFESEKKDQIDENWVVAFNKSGKKNLASRALYFILGLPIALIGAIHNFIPYFLIKRFVEKTFKRDVFWSGVKIILGWVFAALINIPLIFIGYHFIYESYLVWLAYYFTVPALSGVFAYNYFKKLGDTRRFNKASEEKLKHYGKEREQLLNSMKELELI